MSLIKSPKEISRSLTLSIHKMLSARNWFSVRADRSWSLQYINTRRIQFNNVINYLTFKIVRINAVPHSLMEAVQSKNCLTENRDSSDSINSVLHSCKALSKHALFFRPVLTFRNAFKSRKRQWACGCGLLGLNPFNINNSSSPSQGLNQVLIFSRVEVRVMVIPYKRLS